MADTLEAFPMGCECCDCEMFKLFALYNKEEVPVGMMAECNDCGARYTVMETGPEYDA